MRSVIAVALLASVPSVVVAEDCSPLHFVYARATTEPPQNYGGTVEGFDTAAAKIWSKGYGAAGASLFSNVTKLIPGTTGRPVHYPASAGESMPKGIEDMLAHLKKMSGACPKQKYVIGGHSQGGMVTVRAIPKIEKNILDRIVAVTMFGSPACPKEVTGKCKSYCNKGDFVCDAANAKGKGGKAGGPKMGGMPKMPKEGGMPKMPKEGGAPKSPVEGAPPKMPKESAPKETAPKESAPKAAPKDSAPKAAPPKDSMSAPAAPAPAKAPEGMAMGGHAHGRRNVVATLPPDCGAAVEETGFETKNPEGPHLAYNKDGHYIWAAACYIAEQFKKAA